MPPKIEVLPDQDHQTEPLFESGADFARFEEAFLSRVTPEIEKAMEARLRSEHESRERLLR